MKSSTYYVSGPVLNAIVHAKLKKIQTFSLRSSQASRRERDFHKYLNRVINDTTFCFFLFSCCCLNCFMNSIFDSPLKVTHRALVLSLYALLTSSYSPKASITIDMMIICIYSFSPNSSPKDQASIQLRTGGVYSTAPPPPVSSSSQNGAISHSAASSPSQKLGFPFLIPLHLNTITGASLVAQWLRIRLPMQGTQVRALVWEDPTCRGATKPVRHNY